MLAVLKLVKAGHGTMAQVELIPVTKFLAALDFCSFINEYEEELIALNRPSQ